MLDTRYATFYQRGPELDRRCEAIAGLVTELKGLPYRFRESDVGSLHPQLSLKINWPRAKRHE